MPIYRVIYGPELAHDGTSRKKRTSYEAKFGVGKEAPEAPVSKPERKPYEYERRNGKVRAMIQELDQKIDDIETNMIRLENHAIVDYANKGLGVPVSLRDKWTEWQRLREQYKARVRELYKREGRKCPGKYFAENIKDTI